MIETANGAACFMLLVYLLPVANIARTWRHVLSVWAMACVAMLQVLAPLFDSIPDADWPATLLNVTLVVMITVWRAQLWHGIREAFR